MSEVIIENAFVPDKFLLMERKYELAIEQLKAEFSQQISVLNSQINSLTAEIGSLRTKLDDVKTAQVVNHVSEPQQKLVVEVPPPPASAEKKEHPRQGSFKSEDVPIDKYFYFGNKKF